MRNEPDPLPAVGSADPLDLGIDELVSIAPERP